MKPEPNLAAIDQAMAAPQVENPPAFPSWDEFEQFDTESGRWVKHHLPSEGMSLRDYFAAQALSTLTSGEMWIAIRDEAVERKVTASAAVAKFAYDIADALLAARGSK